MTTTQKTIAVIGLVAMIATLAFAPHDYTAKELISGQTASGSVYAAVGSADAAVQRKLDGPVGTSSSSGINAHTGEAVHQTAGANSGMLVVDARLATGQLALLWAGIAAVTAVAMILAAPTPTSGQRSQQ